MITLVKNESFKAFERAYNTCFGVTYTEEKALDLERDCVKRRFLRNKKAIMDYMNSRGISNEEIIAFVDSVRHGTLVSTEFIQKCRYKMIPLDYLVELINDVGSRRISILLKFVNEGQDINEKLLHKIVMLTGIMIEIRIDTYSFLSKSGSYDSWCRSDEIAVHVTKYFKNIYNMYRNEFAAILRDKFAADGLENSEIERKICGILNCHGHIPDQYGLDEKKVQIYSLMDHVSILLSGMCEWYWNED